MLTKEEKLELYEQAKEAYYNGQEIMSDSEFDKLESDLGLENKGYIGTHHSEEYTIKHPFLMGSLSKVQIKEDLKHEFKCKNNTNIHIDFSKFYTEVESYLKKSKNYGLPNYLYQVTPKYDGCSVEIVIDSKGNFESASTRGDGEYGKDIKIWMDNIWERDLRIKAFQLFKYGKISEDVVKLVVRGECLVKKSIFDRKYKQEFTNPRSFVAGVLGQDWKNFKVQEERRKDLDLICYDYRFVKKDGSVEELDYMNPKLFKDVKLPGVFPEFMIKDTLFFSPEILENYYNTFNDFRNNKTEYALDGFVFKPNPVFRLQELNRERQQDCVAVKFLPEIVSTVIEDIEWNVGKTGEYFPTAICKEVILGNKKVTRASLYNYSNLITNKICIGTEIDLSLAGDIIPFVYNVKNSKKTFNILKMKVPQDSYIVYNGKDDSGKPVAHLMKDRTKEENELLMLISSANALKINGLGEKIVEKLFNEVKHEDNILKYMTDENLNLIKTKLGDSKSTNNIIESLKNRRNTLTVYEIVLSLCFPNCGTKMSALVTNIICGKDVDTKGANKEVIEWAKDEDSAQRYTLQKYFDMFGINPLEVKKEDKEEDTKKIKVILTGDPSVCTNYATKKKWLEAHKQYEETTSWKEVEILFTNDLESNTSKMQKAKKMGIEIKKYEK